MTAAVHPVGRKKRPKRCPLPPSCNPTCNFSSYGLKRTKYPFNFGRFAIAMMTIRAFSLFRRVLLLFLCAAVATLATGCGKQTYRPAYTQTRAVSGSGAAIAASAKSQLGRPYVSGGTSPSRGFDCSGLVYWACASNGISVPRISRDQASAGQRIKRGNLRPGDIVVFKIPRSGYHTGIYIGQNSFVHSPKPRARVRIESLSVDYWDRYYVTARRVARR